MCFFFQGKTVAEDLCTEITINKLNKECKEEKRKSAGVLGKNITQRGKK